MYSRRIPLSFQHIAHRRSTFHHCKEQTSKVRSRARRDRNPKMKSFLSPFYTAFPDSCKATLLYLFHAEAWPFFWPILRKGRSTRLVSALTRHPLIDSNRSIQAYYSIPKPRIAIKKISPPEQQKTGYKASPVPGFAGRRSGKRSSAAVSNQRAMAVCPRL